ncbi:MAG: glycosyltransferase [Betaproteobacteria bacterium]|nr:glycosyltransferase [Betaproteobacteria bacterium]
MTTRRNEPCPCGSGQRFKQCCGAAPGAGPGGALRSFAETMSAALTAQTAGALDQAATAYEAALAMDPRCFDALHMLGVVRLQQGHAEHACRLLLQALPLQPLGHTALLRNLGLALAAVAKLRDVAAVAQAADVAPPRYLLHHTDLPALASDPPLVSVVAPCYNHARYVAQALASVMDQDYPSLELIVVDDGSTDDSVAIIRRTLAGAPLPYRIITHENRGAHAAINEGVSLATGRYIGILNTDDRYAPERVGIMVRALQHRDARWGFSKLTLIDGNDQPIRYGDTPEANALFAILDEMYRHGTASAAFSTANPALTSGNLFFDKSLWQELGGFQNLRYNHDWAFALAAVLQAEPCFVDEPLYHYRLHAGNTIKESTERARAEADALLLRWHRALETDAVVANASLERSLANRPANDFALMAKGAWNLVGTERLLGYADELGFSIER